MKSFAIFVVSLLLPPTKRKPEKEHIMSASLQHWLRKSIASEFPNHPVGWVAKRNAQNRQCSCASSHLSPFPSGGNFFLFQRYVLIKIRGGGFAP
jgi:hypothetical protein